MTLPLACLRPGLVAPTLLPARVASSYLGLYRFLRAKRRSASHGYNSRFSTCAIKSAEAIGSISGASNPTERPSDNGPRIRFGDENKPKTDEQKWPRYTPQKNVVDLRTFAYRYKNANLRDAASNADVAVRGRVWSIRKAGTKLAFIDLMQDGISMQCVLKFNSLEDMTVKSGAFKTFVADLDRGDIISIRGTPYRTPSNELSLLATELPKLLSKCTMSLPEKIVNQETKVRNRHVGMIIDRRPAQILHLRSEILKFMRNFLLQDGFVDVQTPILADAAGGAVARPFTTYATEFEEKQLSLRIAPELWLKRLIIGGLERVFEIGPSFRNEGINMNHNPEFWTCEFYKTYADLNELIRMTEKMFNQLSQGAKAVLQANDQDLSGFQADFSPPYRQLDFIPAIEQSIQYRLPDLTSPNAFQDLVAVFGRYKLPLPSHPTLPRLLDKLSSKYLESQCKEPTWIVNHPECLSPLSKSFTRADNGQRVAARAELFVNGQELVNTYEEENSPIEQRHKFENQLLHKDPESSHYQVDEAYLEALGWGMPPTGGWGCGIDRLCMLFAGTPRIADVLSFGTLRHVVGKSQENRLQSQSSSKFQPESEHSSNVLSFETPRHVVGRSQENRLQSQSSSKFQPESEHPPNVLSFVNPRHVVGKNQEHRLQSQSSSKFQPESEHSSKVLSFETPRHVVGKSQENRLQSQSSSKFQSESEHSPNVLSFKTPRNVVGRSQENRLQSKPERSPKMLDESRQDPFSLPTGIPQELQESPARSFFDKKTKIWKRPKEFLQSQGLSSAKFQRSRQGGH